MTISSSESGSASPVRGSTLHVDFGQGKLTGSVTEIVRTLGDMSDSYEDRAAVAQLDPHSVVYRVHVHRPVPEGTVGGLFFGTTFIRPGRVGHEYFMTKGHFHKKRHCGEYYWALSGMGLLVLMDESRQGWSIRLERGAVHYVPGFVAHRLINVGDSVLSVGACWPSDAGHDYASVAGGGFSVRVRNDGSGEQIVVVG